MTEKKNGGSIPILIFLCPGAADVGELTDQSACQMNCAAIGGRVLQYVDDSKAAKNVIIIDGCSSACAKKTLIQLM